MGVFGLDLPRLRAAVDPGRIPLCGNEHRIARVAFDLFRLDEDKENLWQVQADDDGNEFLVRTYELPKDDLQTKSNWSVVEDGKRAGLTVSYHGMPINRVVASDYGASTPDEVGLLRDLLQAKLADDGFAGRFLMSLPEPKRAALAASFPKIAAILPKIPTPTGNDPLGGIGSIDPKREYGIDPKAKSDLPSPGEWERHPLMAKDEDPWRDQSFRIDMGRPSLREEAKAIVPKVMAYLRDRPGKRVSLNTLYVELEVNDIPLYMALHALVKGGLVDGVSPYDVPSAEMAALMGQEETTHKDLRYSVGGLVLQNADEGESEGPSPDLIELDRHNADDMYRLAQLANAHGVDWVESEQNIPRSQVAETLREAANQGKTVVRVAPKGSEFGTFWFLGGKVA